MLAAEYLHEGGRASCVLGEPRRGAPAPDVAVDASLIGRPQLEVLRLQGSELLVADGRTMPWSPRRSRSSSRSWG